MIHFISFRCIFQPICCLFEAEIYRKYTDHLSPRSLQVSTLALDMQPDKSSKKSCCYERKTSESSWLTWTCYIIWRDMSFNRDHHVEQWNLGTETSVWNCNGDWIDMKRCQMNPRSFKHSRAGCCPCPPTSAFTFIHGDSFGGAMCGYQDDVDQDFGDLQQNFQILTCFFDFGVLLQDKLTSSINRQIPPPKKLPGCDIFFSKICSTKTLAAISASNMTGSRSW